MRQKLIEYIDLLFTGASGAEDMKQEILSNTLDRFDDLISQGKTPEAAYHLAITGIGDIGELLDQNEKQEPSVAFSPEAEMTSTILKKKSVNRVLGILCTVVYLLVSFLTGAWYCTWLLFPIFGCVRGLISAIIDLKEVFQHEN